MFNENPTMNDQTSVQKGDELEIKTFELLKEMLSNNEFYVSGKNSKIFRKKGYYSVKRNANIVFDVTIETFIPGAKEYSFLTIIECKNLKKNVSPDDVEEFSSKISQVGEHNTKGIIITTSHFQTGALAFAKSQAIGIIRLTTDNKFDWINYRKNNVAVVLDSNHLLEQFTSDKKGKEKFIGVINDKAVSNFADLLLELKIIDFYRHKEKFINVPFVTEKKIDEIIDKMRTHDIYDGLMLDSDKLCSFLSRFYPITFDFETSLPDELMGKIEFEELKITISKTLKSDINRWRFTLAHEVGHLILHYKILNNRISEKTDNELTMSFKYFVTEMTTRRLEFQANIFASHLLIPEESLMKLVYRYFAKENIHSGHLYLDHQPINQQIVFTFLNEISTKFGVSVEVAKIRLIGLKLLEDHTDMSLKTILKKLKAGDY